MSDGQQASRVHQLLNFIEKRFEYIKCMEQGPAAKGSAQHIDSLNKSADAVATQVTSSKPIDLDVGSKLHELILKSPFDEDQQAALVSRVHEKVDMQSSASKLKQVNMSVHNQMVAEDWVIVLDKTASTNRRLMQTAQAFNRIRLINADEKTLAHGVGIGTITDAPVERELFLGHLVRFKEFVTNAGALSIKGPLLYPSTVEELEQAT